MEAGGAELASKLNQGSTQVPSWTPEQRTAVASTLATPVELDMVTHNKAATFGTGFAPFFLPLALFIGGLIIWMLLTPLQSRPIVNGLGALRVVLASYWPAVVLAVCQVMVMYVVVHFGVGLKARYPVATVAFLVLIAATFLALIQAFNAVFGVAVGRVLTLAFLMLQLVSAGGIYPVETDREAVPGHSPLRPDDLCRQRAAPADGRRYRRASVDGDHGSERDPGRVDGGERLGGQTQPAVHDGTASSTDRGLSAGRRPCNLSWPTVITRMSELFLRTLRDDPADAEVPSHKLLIRAGYVRPIGPGLYSWLPLGLRVLRQIESIVREEMVAIGGQEILFPALLPRAPYETTNRWTEYGDGVFRLKDRRDNDYLLGPTHEEMFTLTVKGEYASYKDFPVLLFQIQTKYRDEARPRAGILRGREFVMKDSYSFDVDDDGLRAVYLAHRDAYQKMFSRMGVRYVIVSAVSGAMGGSASEEFLAESEVGEDTFVRCLQSGYAANVEAVTTAVPDPLPVDGLADPGRARHRRHPHHRVAGGLGQRRGPAAIRRPCGHRRGHPQERAAEGPCARRRVGTARHRCAR